mgnify:FL=1
MPNSPAAKAGRMAEDIIIELNGKKITQESPLSSHIQQYSVGDNIEITILRGKETMTKKATLEERPN